MTPERGVASRWVEAHNLPVRIACLVGTLVAAGAVVNLVGAASQPIPPKVVRHLRVQYRITLRLANPSQAKVSLSQAVSSLGRRLQGHKPVGGWLVRFTDGNGQLFNQRLAWLVVARGIKFPVLGGPGGSYRANGCWFVGAISRHFLEGLSC